MTHDAIVDLLRKRLGMPPDHPRLHELRIWADTWLTDRPPSPAHVALDQLPEAARQALISAISVPESWFWRYPSQLQRVVARVQQRPPDSPPLKIWSACCAGGEEPYTLLLMLDAAGLADRVEIVATDINPDKLRQAREGAYSERAVRQIPEMIRRKAFTANGQTYVLDSRYRTPIRFLQLDLLAFAQGQAEPPLPRPDVILCRNALIYFDRHHQSAITHAFLRITRPGAWLLTGHTERLPIAPETPGPFWKLITAPDHTLYEHVTETRVKQVHDIPRQPSRAQPHVPGGHGHPRTTHGDTHEHALAGSPKRHSTGGQSPLRHKVQTFLEDARQASDPETIIALCRKALYLMPDLPEAHWLLWQAARQAGHDALASRHARILRKWLDSLAQPTMLNVEPPVSSEEVSAALTDEGSAK